MKEAFNREVYEDETGFISFQKVKGLPMCYEVDIYVDPEFRGTGAVKKLESVAIDWAKKNGCNSMLTSVNKDITTPERSIVEIIKAGYKYSSTKENLLYFVKDIQGDL